MRVDPAAAPIGHHNGGNGHCGARSGPCPCRQRSTADHTVGTPSHLPALGAPVAAADAASVAAAAPIGHHNGGNGHCGARSSPCPCRQRSTADHTVGTPSRLPALGAPVAAAAAATVAGVAAAVAAAAVSAAVAAVAERSCCDCCWRELCLRLLYRQLLLLRAATVPAAAAPAIAVVDGSCRCGFAEPLHLLLPRPHCYDDYNYYYYHHYYYYHYYYYYYYYDHDYHVDDDIDDNNQLNSHHLMANCTIRAPPSLALPSRAPASLATASHAPASRAPPSRAPAMCCRAHHAPASRCGPGLGSSSPRSTRQSACCGCCLGRMTGPCPNHNHGPGSGCHPPRHHPGRGHHAHLTRPIGLLPRRTRPPPPARRAPSSCAPLASCAPPASRATSSDNGDVAGDAVDDDYGSDNHDDDE